MTKHLAFAVVFTALSAIVFGPVQSAIAQHGHGGHGHGHGGHGHGGHGHGGHAHGGHGYGGHWYGGHGHGGHGYGHDWGHGHGISFGYGHGWGNGHSYGHHGIHADWHFVLPHYDHHYHGTYYIDSGLYYYQPRTYVVESAPYVASKPVAVEFGSYSHVDDLVGRLERLANDFCLDMHYNYSHNPGFRESYRDAYEILELAKYMHAAEHQEDRAEIARCVQELDPLFHHLQASIGTWDRHHYRQVGDADLATKTDLMEATLHHLMNDVGIQPHSPQTFEAAPAPAIDEVAPPPAGHQFPPSPAGPINQPPPATLQ